jgi:AraC family transcriptional regulator
MPCVEQQSRPEAHEAVRLIVATDLPPCDGVSARFESTVLGVHLGPPARVRQRREDQSFEGVYQPGQLTLIPAGWLSECSTPARTSFVHVHIGAGLPGEALGEALRDVPCLFRFEDAVCRELALSMREEVEQDGAAARLYLESAALVLAQRLSRRALRAAPSAGLSARALRRVLDRMHAGLGENLGVKELAAAAGVSLPHFSRMFRRSTGESPHRYCRLRVERACQLLADAALAPDPRSCAAGVLRRAYRSASGWPPEPHAGPARRDD